MFPHAAVITALRNLCTRSMACAAVITALRNLRTGSVLRPLCHKPATHGATIPQRYPRYRSPRQRRRPTASRYNAVTLVTLVTAATTL